MSKNSKLLGSLILLVEVSRVAKSISLTNTCLFSLLLYISNNVFIIVDLPALVYPTNATTGTLLVVLALRLIFRAITISSSSALTLLIRFSICLRSNSSFVSPLPRRAPLAPPPPPPILERLVYDPARRGSLNFSSASSTCKTASFVFALVLKISSINIVRSNTAVSI